MVDITEAMESNYISVEMVKQSPSKKLCLIEPGQYEPDDYGNRKLTLVVNIDGKRKQWRPNKTTMQNLSVLGKDTTEWLGKPITLSIGLYMGKEIVIGSIIEEVTAIKSSDGAVIKKTTVRNPEDMG